MDIDEIKKLSISERIQIVGEIWNSIADDLDKKANTSEQGDALPDDVIMSKPVSKQELLEDEIYRKAFIEDTIKQSDRFDELAKILFNIELASFSVYTLLLKFFVDNQILPHWGWMVSIYSIWIIALIFTLRSFIPEKYDVLKNQTRRKALLSPAETSYTIPEFYEAVAKRKRDILFLSVGLFLFGLLLIFLSFLS